MHLIFFALIILSVVFEVSADILFKEWANQNRAILLGFGILLYVGSTIIWAYSLKYDLLSKAISIFTVINLIAVILAGFLLFNETVSPIGMIGIVLGVISVVLLSI